MFTLGKLAQLKHGHAFGWDAFTGFGQTLHRDTPAYFEASAAWEFLRPQILREWVTMARRPGDHGGPGTRPFAWWMFDARERRRRIDGKPHPFDDPARQAYIANLETQHPGQRGRYTRLFYGAPCCLMRGEGFDDFGMEFEEEFEFIDRLNLWLPGELALGVPVLAADIAKLRASLNDGPKEPTSQDLDRLRRFDAVLVALTAKLEATS
jgi:hypothetical protein